MSGLKTAGEKEKVKVTEAFVLMLFDLVQAVRDHWFVLLVVFLLGVLMGFTWAQNICFQATVAAVQAVTSAPLKPF